MPKQKDPEMKGRAIRLVDDHLGEYPSLTVAATAAGKQLGVGKETVRRWVGQAQVDSGQCVGIVGEENNEIKRLKNKNCRLREDVAIENRSSRPGIPAKNQRV